MCYINVLQLGTQSNRSVKTVSSSWRHANVKAVSSVVVVLSLSAPVGTMLFQGFLYVLVKGNPVGCRTILVRYIRVGTML